MTLPILTIRPAPGDAATVRRAQELGLSPLSAPMFVTEPVAWDIPSAGTFDAVLFGSANVLRHGGDGLRALTGLPAYCVGATTARVATAAGFRVAGTGTGGLQSALQRACADGCTKLLRLSGEARVALSIPPGITVEERIAYRVRALPMPPDVAQLLSKPAVVLLHSGEAASHFAAQCDRMHIDRNLISLACLGPRIAAMAGAGWRHVAIAEHPDDGALLAIAAQLCQGDAGPDG